MCRLTQAFCPTMTPSLSNLSGRTGRTDVEAGIFRELEKYNISLDKCFVTCYEATFSNYCLKNGAHFRIEKNLSFRFNAASNCMARNPM